ncbi:MAG: hypothetical protein ACLFV7_09965 [Phycisphaerae bacterium]
MNLRRIILIATAVACVAGLLRADDRQATPRARPRLTPDKPLTDASRKGDVTGTLSPARRVHRVWLEHRTSGKRYKPDRWDPNSGAFAFCDLPGATRYDVCLETTDGREIEGIDLSPPDQRLLKLAERRREQLDLPAERTHRFTREDANELVQWVAQADDLLEDRRVLYVQGHGKRATLLVELMRTRAFHASGGAIVWRVDLWHFHHQFGGWDRLANTETTLRRLRVRPDDWKKVHVEWTPALTADVDADGKSEPLRFRIPDKANPAIGRTAGTKMKLESAPVILGVQKQKPKEPTTRPASGK